jgi:hypothetical protein
MLAPGPSCVSQRGGSNANGLCWRFLAEATPLSRAHAGLAKPILSSITAFGPIGIRPGVARLSLRKTILSRQTLRRKSSNTWIVSCSPGQRR